MTATFTFFALLALVASDVHAAPTNLTNDSLAARDHPSRGLHQGQALHLPLRSTEGDKKYTVSMNVGTVPVKMQLDTGSDVSWVYQSTMLDLAEDGKEHKRDNIDLYYGGGEHMHGYWWEGPISFAARKLKESALTIITSTHTDTVEGLFGMGYRQQKHPSEVMKKCDIWRTVLEPFQRKAFGVYFERSSRADPSTPNRAAGMLTLGGVNADLFKGNIEYLPIVNDEWIVPLTGFKVVQIGKVVGPRAAIGGKMPKDAAPLPAVASKKLAMIDTGAVNIYAPTKDLQRVYRDLGVRPARTSVEGDIVFPCGGVTQAVLNIQLGTRTYSVPHVDLIKTVGSADYWGMPETVSRYWCTPAIVDSTIDDWILGAAFHKNVYTVYDHGVGQIGFAKLANPKHFGFEDLPKLG